MNSQQIKEILLSEIHEVSINYEKYCNDPKHDFPENANYHLN